MNFGKKYPPEGGAEALPPPNPTRPRHEVAQAPVPVGPAPVAPQAAPQARPPAAAGEWLQAYREIQQQTASIHDTYQQSMAASHQAFLRLAQNSSANLMGVSGEPLPEMAPLAQAAPPAMAPSVPPPAPPAYAPPPVVLAPASMPAPGNGNGNGNGTGNGNGGAVEVRTEPLNTEEARAMLLAVVAEKTGYPEEILAMDMDLEADLGIDSIKRVEILSALQERAPQMPELDASELPTMQSLGQVLAFLEQMQAGGASGKEGQGDSSKNGKDASAVH